jgi:alkanesulfonate monooxygenase SsuD/methylene tetrahydromethanopterin reductase-like flavin-dependent oxidoreductase (luciferase family)
MSRPVRFGVTLPQIKRSWQEAKAAAIDLDARGYDSLWVCDHLYGVPRADIPILEAWTQLSAVAALTEQAKVGTLVTPPFFRNPAVLAQQIATIDQIAPGRVIAGMGAGWYEAEFRGHGCEFPSIRERLRALEESVEIMRRMWTEEKASYRGQYYSIADVTCAPKPLQRPEILIGGSGEKVLMGIAARLADTWNNQAPFQAQLPDKVAALRRRCEEVDRDPDSIEISQQCIVIIDENEDKARAHLAKASKIYGGHMGSALEKDGIWGGPERVIDCIEQQREHGVSLFVMEFFGRDPQIPAEIFAEGVMPAFAGQEAAR